MGKRAEDVSGQTFGRWTVLHRAENKGNKVMFTCICSCENKTIKDVPLRCLRSGESKSCGCFNKEMHVNVARKNFTKQNTYKLNNDVCIGYDNAGKEFCFDFDDYELIKDYYFYVDNHGYCVADRESYGFIKLHNLIMKQYNTSKVMADHINGIRTDNRKCNLRLVNNTQNCMNGGIRSHNTSGYKGVSFDKRRDKYRSYITYYKKTIHLGYYDNIDDAILARKDAEEKYFGKYNREESDLYNVQYK